MSLNLRTSGRAVKPVTAELERALVEADLESLQTERGIEAPPVVKEFRERHHALARLIAEGKRPGEAALLHRYSQSRMSILLGDPAFQELVEHYRGLVEGQFIDFQAKLAELALDSAHLLQERMEQTPDELSNGLLLQILQVGADRTGHGPTQKTQVDVRVGLADRLATATSRANLAKNITPLEIDNGDNDA